MESGFRLDECRLNAADHAPLASPSGVPQVPYVPHMRSAPRVGDVLPAGAITGHMPVPPNRSPSSPWDAAVQGFGGSEREQALHVLGSYGLLPVEVDRDGECFFNAFRQTALPVGVRGASLNNIEMRELAAATLEDSQWRARIPDHALGDARASFVGRQIRQGGGIDPRLLTDEGIMWRSIAAQIRAPGSWANEGADLVPYLIALTFGVQIRVLHPNGAREMIGDPTAGLVVTLLHSLNHWDGTALRQQPSTGQPYAHSAFDDQNNVPDGSYAGGSQGGAGYGGYFSAFLAGTFEAMVCGL